MHKLDDQVLSSYQKMLEKEEEPAEPSAPKQSIFSPAKTRQLHTPLKKTPHKTPSKTEIENQRLALQFKF